MVDTALLWIGLLVVVGVAVVGLAVRRYRDTSEPPLRALAAAAVCVAGVAELAMANGYLGSVAGHLLAGAGLLTAGALLVGELIGRWRAWGA